MSVLRCTAKLLKRLKQPAKPPEPAPEANPLGEWYADIDVWRRQPFVVMLNAATGAVLVLPGDASGLRRLQERALLQFAAITQHYEIQGPSVDAELHGFHVGFAFASTRDRSLVSSLNRRKLDGSGALRPVARGSRSAGLERNVSAPLTGPQYTPQRRIPSSARSCSQGTAV